jgi:hypothetical protein
VRSAPPPSCKRSLPHSAPRLCGPSHPPRCPTMCPYTL